MKTHLKLALFVSALLFQPVVTGIASAQDASASDQQGAGVLASLSSQDKIKLLKARKQVLADNPDLKTEQDSLAKQREALKGNDSASQADKMALLKSYVAHEKKMKEAMLKVDPSLAPVFDQLQGEVKDKVKARAAAAQGN